MGVLRTAGIVALAGAALLSLSGCAFWKIPQAIELAKNSEPFEQTPRDAALRLLVVGDSTAVGTGASSPSRSVAGLIAEGHSALRVENRGRDGARFADVLEQLRAASAPGQRFDIVLVQAGGNDVIRLSDLDQLGSRTDEVVAAAAKLAPLVLVMPSGNVGNAPFFYPPLSWWMTARSRHLHDLVEASAQRPGVIYIDLFRERANDPFVAHPELNAADGLHPSDAGYAQWFSELDKQADLSRRLAAARTRNMAAEGSAAGNVR